MPAQIAKTLAVVVQVALICGCASTASLSRLQPAENDMAGVRRVAVLPIAGPQEQAAVAQQALLATLNETGRFRLIGPAELQLASPLPLLRPDGSVDRDAALAAAGRSRADAVLRAALNIQEQSGGSSLPFLTSDSTVTVVCQLEMIDVRSGQSLFDERVQQSYRGALSDSASDANSRTRVYQRLAASSATAAARKITPHHTASDVPLVATTLGESNAALRRGNCLAREGQWNDALKQYQIALIQNPENHGAMYSVGLAFEAQGDFRRAEQSYRAAIQRSDSSLYRQALERAESAAREYQLAQAQIQAPHQIMPPSLAWRQPWSEPSLGSTIALAAARRSTAGAWRPSDDPQLADAAEGGFVHTAIELRRLPADTAPQTQESRVPSPSGREPLYR